MLSRNGYINTDQKNTYKRRKKSIYSLWTQIGVGKEYFWIWVATQPVNKVLLDIYLSSAESKHVCCQEVFTFFSWIIWKTSDLYRYVVQVYIDMYVNYRTQVIIYIHLPYHEKNECISERTIQYAKGWTQCFDEYFLYTKSKCKLNPIKNWFNSFVCYYYNREVIV